MARVIVCDRCNLRLLQVGQKIIEHGEYEYDLCPDCHKEFKKFIRGEEPNPVFRTIDSTYIGPE